MTVDELRKALEGVPGDMEVLTYDEGYLKESEDVQAEVVSCATGAMPAFPTSNYFRVIWEFSRHPEGTVGKKYFLIC
jgi:hypothetical protein